jgi:hypothetical protein
VDETRTARPEKTTLVILRQGLLAILFLGTAGTLLELLLLKHYEDFWQLVPVVLLGAILLVLGWYVIAKNAASVKVLRGVMLLCLLSGGVGVTRHYIANVRDAGESNPSLQGRELYVEAVQGSIPALAPGSMVQLALLGLAFSFRHPLLGSKNHEDKH